MLRRGFTKLELTVVVGAMVVLLSCMGFVLPLQFLAILLFGWAWHVYRLIGLVRIDWPELAGAAFLLGLFGLGLHWFCSWFATAKRARQLSESKEPTAVQNESIASKGQSLWRPKWTVAMVAVTVLMFVAGISMVGITHQAAWLLAAEEPLVTSGREAARQSSSQSNLKQIGIGLHIYHDTLDNFPPGATSDDQGNLLHGWMTTLLPYVEQNQLAEKIDHELPWTDPKNQVAMKTIVKPFTLPYPQMPSRDAKEYALAGYSSNQHVIGGTGGLKMDRITDGTSNTLMAGEALGNYKPWGHPRNWRDPALGINQSPDGFGGPRKSGGVMVLADGTVRHLSTETDPTVLKALATPSGGEPLPADLP